MSPRVIHIADLSTLGHAAADTLNHVLNNTNHRAATHTLIAAADPHTTALLARHAIAPSHTIPARARPPRVRAHAARRAVLAILNKHRHAPAVIQPWGAGAARTAAHAQLHTLAPIAPAAAHNAPGDWPALPSDDTHDPTAIAAALHRRWATSPDRLVVLHIQRPPAPLNTPDAAYHTGVPAMAGFLGVAVAPLPAAHAPGRALRLTERHHGAWALVFENQPLHRLAPAADIAACARPASPHEHTHAPAELLTLARARVPIIVERATPNTPDPAEDHPALAATRFIDPTDRMAMPRAIAALATTLRDPASPEHQNIQHRLDAAQAAAQAHDPETWTHALHERWHRTLNAAGRNHTTNAVPAPAAS